MWLSFRLAIVNALLCVCLYRRRIPLFACVRFPFFVKVPEPPLTPQQKFANSAPLPTLVSEQDIERYDKDQDQWVAGEKRRFFGKMVWLLMMRFYCSQIQLERVLRIKLVHFVFAFVFFFRYNWRSKYFLGFPSANDTNKNSQETKVKGRLLSKRVLTWRDRMTWHDEVCGEIGIFR